MSRVGRACRAGLLTGALTLAALAISAPTRVDSPLPDPQLTPGVADRAVTLAQIDKPGFAASRRRVGVGLRVSVFRAYGRAPNGRVYELDHLVALCLGGTNDARNLWPQRWHLIVGGRDVGARTKDRLELYYLRRVRARRLSIRDAQDGMSRDWIASYRAHLGEPPKPAGSVAPPPPLRPAGARR